MQSSFQEIPLAEIVSIKGGKRLPLGTSLQQTPSSHPYIRVRDVGQRSLSRVGIEYVPDDVFPSISRYIVQRNDIVVSIVGTIGALSLVDDFYDNASLTENCVKLTGLGYFDALYLYYYLSSSRGRYEISKGTVGAVQPKLPIYNIEKIKVLWPSDGDVRRSIATVLGRFDDKIDVNRLINSSLEAIAQAIFKSWFVDFDPVKAKIAAKAEGQDPLRAAMRSISGKTDAELDSLPLEQLAQLASTATLFPDEMEESELGDIPKGWGVGGLERFCDLNAKSWTSRTLPQSVCYVDLSSTKKGDISDVQYLEGSAIPSRARRILDSGDTIIGTVRPENRSYALVGQTGWTGSTGFAVLHPKRPCFREFVYVAATSDDNIDRLAHLADGGAYPAVRPELVVEGLWVLPSDAVVAEYSASVAAMFDQVLLNRKLAESLADLRSTLLPKLLSGELEVQTIEVGAAA